MADDGAAAAPFAIRAALGIAAVVAILHCAATLFSSGYWFDEVYTSGGRRAGVVDGVEVASGTGHGRGGDRRRPDRPRTRMCWPRTGFHRCGPGHRPMGGHGGALVDAVLVGTSAMDVTGVVADSMATGAGRSFAPVVGFGGRRRGDDEVPGDTAVSGVARAGGDLRAATCCVAHCSGRARRRLC